MGLLVNLLHLSAFSSIAYKPHSVEYPKANVTIKCKAYGGELDALPHLQTLRKFPREELVEKVALVRFDSTLLLQEQEKEQRFQSNAVFTIKYLHQSGAKVVLVSDWSAKTNPKVFAAQSVAGFLSSILDYKVVPVQCISHNTVSKTEGFEKADILLLENLSDFRGEVANCSKFARVLSSGVDIFVNDYFSRSHKILASTCGVARFCYACLAGFHFEESLYHLRRLAETSTKPYVAIIGGSNLSDKAAAVHTLASICDGLVFVGMMSFQIMHALGLSVPLNLVEHGALKEALDIVQFAHNRNVQILYPNDFWCKNDRHPKQLEIYPAHAIPDGWVPVDIGPVSLDGINSILTKCKKVTWIGPVKFHTNSGTKGASKVAQLLNQLSRGNSNITVIGNMACQAMVKESNSIFHLNMLENASVVWEFLKGRKLPGIMALDRAFPFDIDWKAAYSDPAQPLVVDIGSGNGMFLFGMAKTRKDLNFLGLEINKKLVKRCLDSSHQSGIRNGYFIATNATSTFRSIVSSYPGKLVLVSIQCPNPDFNEPEHRWRMLQRSLVEAVADILTVDGKVFLQSDIEVVSVRMKEQFLRHGKGKLTIVHEQSYAINNEGWLKDNPFGVRSDWEQHVLDRGAPMYRLMLCKSASSE
ncbi:putative phosphoglycerate kinase [Rosa chinensis]|uniref:Phosphoglycerate kinase n=1 Tax=Rosa chinensis TaxID=74649 RepID=A0A2P6RAX9_ROSCH|nr:phosphoglycerate kinase [Rosa chinensis]XP_024186363.2 phosphoglycerate kinase [Rosa chinensis]PRQ43595.1 putative phosphoglycerate kinase [Rosa chinensis]